MFSEIVGFLLYEYMHTFPKKKIVKKKFLYGIPRLGRQTWILHKFSL